MLAVRISVIVTGCFGHHDRVAAPLDTGVLVVTEKPTSSGRGQRAEALPIVRLNG